MQMKLADTEVLAQFIKVNISIYVFVDVVDDVVGDFGVFLYRVFFHTLIIARKKCFFEQE
jgi:hypothetical protein